MKKKGFISVRRNKRRTMQTGGGHTELITNILLKDLRGVQANIANLQPNEKNAEVKPNREVPYAEGRTALYLACRLPIPNPGIVKLLLDNEFNPNSRNNIDANLGNGAYPLHGVVQAIKVNIEPGVGISDTSSSYLAIIQLLKANGADFGLKNSHGLTAYNEYVAYVKPTTKNFYPQFDVDLDTALNPPPPGPPSTPVLPPGPPSTPVLMPPRGRRQYSGVPTGQGAAVWVPPGPPPPLSGGPGQASFGSPPKITIQPTQSLDVISGHSWPIENKNPPPIYSLQNDTGIDPINAFVLCPDHIVTAFRSLPGIQKCKNMPLLNPYNTQRPITLPASIEDFNGKHLQVLARNESVNTTGVMKTSLYGGVLTVEEIATIRCLVKNTTVVGITYPEKTGGYPQGSPIVKIPTRKPTIIVDQCGLQWQNSIYNTGALFFYPWGDDGTVIFEGTDQGTTTTLGKYKRWQYDTYFKMYGQYRPPVGEADPDATWTAMGQSIKGKLKNPVVGFKTEFMQAFHSVHFMADKTPSIKEVHFKFLRAGLGFFSENILLSDRTGSDAPGPGNAPRKTAFLETARLQGICEGISQLGHGHVVACMDGAPCIMIHTKIKRIILPFQTVTIPQMESLNGYLLTSEEDALAQYQHPQYPHLDVTIATTNCADPHAGPGNEGEYWSVDAAIASNTYVHHLNAAFNYANIQSKTFEEIGPVVPGAAAYSPSAAPPPAYPPPAYPPPAYPPPAYPPPAYPHSPAFPPGGAAAAAYSPAFPPGGAAAVHPVRQNQPDIRIQQAPGSSKWISAPQDVQALWPRYLLVPAGPIGFNHEHSSDNIMINPNPNRVMFRHWDPTKRITLEKGVMDVNDIKVYLIGPSLPPNKPNMVPGWYPALDYQIFAYLDFMYNNDEHQQSQGVTYFASANTDNEILRMPPQYRAIKNFDETTLNTQPNAQPVIFTMIRLPNGSICYNKDDAGRTQVMISGIPMERKAYTQAQLPGSPLPMAVSAPMAVAAPMRPIPPPPDSPLGQPGCFGAYCANNFPNLNRYMLTKHPNASRRLGLVRGGKNKNRKQQKLQKQRATRKHKNKKQSRRRGQRQPRHIRGRGSRKSS